MRSRFALAEIGDNDVVGQHTHMMSTYTTSCPSVYDGLFTLALLRSTTSSNCAFPQILVPTLYIPGTHAFPAVGRAVPTRNCLRRVQY